jgi:hypothetical protein
VEREKEKIQEERGECFRHIRRYRYNIESGSTPSPLLHHIWSSIFYFILFYFFFFSLWLAYRLGSLSLSLGTPYTFFFFFFHPNNNKKKNEMPKRCYSGIERVQFVIRLVRLGESSFVAFL